MFQWIYEGKLGSGKQPSNRLMDDGGTDGDSQEDEEWGSNAGSDQEEI